jgi:hypothetical protein
MCTVNAQYVVDWVFEGATSRVGGMNKPGQKAAYHPSPVDKGVAFMEKRLRTARGP